MDTADPLRAVSLTTCLLGRTLGGPTPAASPSKANGALFRGISATLKGSKELIEQSKFATKDYGDIQMAYQDDEGKAAAAAAANYKNNQLGRRPAGERKLHRFTMKYPARKPLPVVDRSVLDTISDPDEYFLKELELEKAEAEIKRLNGEIQPKRPLNFEPVVERERRNPSRPRKSYVFSSGAHAASATMIPLSQSENMIESQTSQDDAHASVSGKNEQAVPSRSDKCAISDSLVEEDSFNEKEGDEITNIMASFQNFQGSDRLDHLRKTIGIGEIGIEKIYRRDSVLGDVSLGSTAGINQQEVRTLEGPLSGSLQARVSELAELIFGDAATDEQTDLLKDDEFEGSPDFVMGEQSLVRDSSDVDLMTEETFSARGKNMEAPGQSAKSAEHVLDPEPNMSDCDTIGDNTCSRHNISTEKDNLPMDYSTIDNNNEAVISSHHLEDASEVLANTPGRNVAPDDTARTSYSSENNIQHQEVVEEDGVVQDRHVHSLEISLEDTGLEKQSHALEGTTKKLRADLRRALSPTNGKTQKTAQQGKTKQQQKRVKKVEDKSRNSLEIPQADFDLENQPDTHDANTEKLIADRGNALLPTKEKTQKTAQRGKNKKQPKRGKKVADESRHSLEMSQADLNSENQPCADVNTEQQTVVMRKALSPGKPKGQKEAQRRKRTQESNKRKSLADAGLEWQSPGVRRSTRIRHRPLEHWRGERFVYGRIHETMVTVIGVKSYSPGEDGKRALKVKSFVPEQYSDIVTQGAEY